MDMPKSSRNTRAVTGHASATVVVCWTTERAVLIVLVFSKIGLSLLVLCLEQRPGHQKKIDEHLMGARSGELSILWQLLLTKVPNHLHYREPPISSHAHITSSDPIEKLIDQSVALPYPMQPKGSKGYSKTITKFPKLCTAVPIILHHPLKHTLLL